MREMIKMVVILSLICGLSGLTLASLKQATASRIEEQKLIFVQGPSLALVFEKAENDPVRDRKSFTLPDGQEIIIFPAMVNGTLKGVAFETFGKGFGGNLGVMVGIDIESQTLSGIGITSMKETPGIGTNVAKHGFTAQFKGHEFSGLSLVSQGGNIDAVSGASISSGAAMEAINHALTIYENLKGQLTTAWPAS